MRDVVTAVGNLITSRRNFLIRASAANGFRGDGRASNHHYRRRKEPRLAAFLCVFFVVWFPIERKAVNPPQVVCAQDKSARSHFVRKLILEPHAAAGQLFTTLNTTPRITAAASAISQIHRTPASLGVKSRSLSPPVMI